MTDPNPVAATRRLMVDAFRTLRRIARQIERRQRYRRLGWV